MRLLMVFRRDGELYFSTHHHGDSYGDAIAYWRRDGHIAFEVDIPDPLMLDGKRFELTEKS